MDTASGTFRAAWAHRRWRTLLASYTVSSLGDLVYAVSIVTYLLETTGGVAWVAISFVGRMIVWILFGAIGGAIAERLDRRRTMVALDLARGGLMVAMAVAVAVDAPPQVVVGIVLLTACAGTVFRPAAVGAVPAVLPETELAAANAAESTVYMLALFVGPALGGLVIATAGFAVAFLVNGASFVISAALIARIGNIGGGVGGATGGRPEGRIAARLRRDIVAGAQVMRRVPGLLALLAVVAAGQFLLGTEQVIQVLIVTERLGWSGAGIGVINAALGAGGLLAALVVGRLARRIDAGALLGAAGIVAGLAFALLAVTTSPSLVLVLSGIEGAMTMIAEVLAITLLQRLCPISFLGRVYALNDSTTATVQLAGCLVAPLVVSLFSLQAAIVVGGAACIITGVVMVPSLIAASRRTSRRTDRLRPRVERLASIGLLADAPEQTLEILAAQVQTRHVAEGTVVIAEGEPADNLYVVESGRYAVSSNGVDIRVMGPDSWFGEIGLLRGIPRTATVIAETDGVLLSIPGQAFLDAVADPGPSDPVRKLMTARLAQTHPSLVTGQYDPPS